MSFDPTIAAIRFGEGLSPRVAPPVSVAQMMDLLRGPDTAASAFPIPTFAALQPDFLRVTELRQIYRKGRSGEDAEALRRDFRRAQNGVSRRLIDSIGLSLSRSITTEDGFRERLTRFWGDHFTVRGRGGLTRWAVPAYLEDAIRPHVAGRFEDMLVAVVTHPMMINYLDQGTSIGPNSRMGRSGRRGMNENLARELLELHTVGVSAGYTQADVRELMELLTGLSFSVKEGFVFREGFAEPGAETVLGVRFGGGAPALSDITDGLRHLARHPATARHIARKLAVHFVSDAPTDELVRALAERYQETGGDLASVYEALLEHDESWATFGAKVKRPIDFISSGYRALEVPAKSLENMNTRKLRSYIIGPLASMGQPWQRPDGPDGWPEKAEAWITPQGLAARLQWALSAPSVIFRSLPDPRAFVQTALGNKADGRISFAAKAAETRREGVGLVLASPGFQRR